MKKFLPAFLILLVLCLLLGIRHSNRTSDPAVPTTSKTPQQDEQRSPEIPPNDSSEAEIATQVATLPVSPNSATTLPPEIAKLWPGGTVLAVHESERLENGAFRRVTRLQPADLPYMVRVDEVLQLNANGSEKLISRQEMVADHVLVQIDTDAAAEAMKSLMPSLGGELGLAINSRGLHRVRIQLLNEMMSSLDSSAWLTFRMSSRAHLASPQGAGIAGVSNIGDHPDWFLNPLNGANLYTYGRHADVTERPTPLAPRHLCLEPA